MPVTARRDPGSVLGENLRRAQGVAKSLDWIVPDLSRTLDVAVHQRMDQRSDRSRFSMNAKPDETAQSGAV
ncbi:MAG: hypothetical protein JOZ08_13335 [Verrucomicrobia bacterium]|nr:hypothetical protein [Verrucomicrobiota bacterium]MBV8275036.1 hypothetical protein [Verrucomicrobiota bacterium]